MWRQRRGSARSSSKEKHNESRFKSGFIQVRRQKNVSRFFSAASWRSSAAGGPYVSRHCCRRVTTSWWPKCAASSIGVFPHLWKENRFARLRRICWKLHVSRRRTTKRNTFVVLNKMTDRFRSFLNRHDDGGSGPTCLGVLGSPCRPPRGSAPRLCVLKAQQMVETQNRRCVPDF